MFQQPRHAVGIALGGCMPEHCLPMTISIVGIRELLQKALDDFFLVSAKMLCIGHLVEQLAGGLVIIPPSQRSRDLLGFSFVLLAQ
eukprot:Skav204870  [mRNA]  locus=scaffold1679:96352:98033:+ [translate_table: standard]